MELPHVCRDGYDIVEALRCFGHFNSDIPTSKVELSWQRIYILHEQLAPLTLRSTSGHNAHFLGKLPVHYLRVLYITKFPRSVLCGSWRRMERYTMAMLFSPKASTTLPRSLKRASSKATSSASTMSRTKSLFVVPSLVLLVVLTVLPGSQDAACASRQQGRRVRSLFGTQLCEACQGGTSIRSGFVQNHACSQDMGPLSYNRLNPLPQANMTLPNYPILFHKPPTSLTGPSSPIPVPLPAQEAPGLDYECELVAIISKPTLNVSTADALSHVLGYSVGNDVSHREWQLKRGGGQWALGKCFDGWAPWGPGIVSGEVLGDPTGLRISTRVNGELRQQGETGDLIFGVAETVSKLSRGTTLLPGDLIFTGT